MADSDGNEDLDEGQEGIDLTAFLFGNINETGQLESDVFDNESRRQLASLGRFV